MTLMERINAFIFDAMSERRAPDVDKAMRFATVTYETLAAERSDLYAYPRKEKVAVRFMLERDFSYLKRIAKKGAKLA